MAAPQNVNMKNITGTWVLNKTLSSDLSDVLAAQKIGWVLRKGISLATITLHVAHQPPTSDSPEKIDIDQVMSGGIKGTREQRILDWTEREHADYVFGKVMGKSRRLEKLEEVEDEVLREGWLTGEGEAGFMQSWVKSCEYDWTAEQIWGFAEINGERRYVRKLKFTTEKPALRLDKVMVYDYVPAAAA